MVGGAGWHYQSAEKMASRRKYKETKELPKHFEITTSKTTFKLRQHSVLSITTIAYFEFKTSQQYIALPHR